MPQVSQETDKCSESSCTTYCVSWSSFFAFLLLGFFVFAQRAIAYLQSPQSQSYKHFFLNSFGGEI